MAGSDQNVGCVLRNEVGNPQRRRTAVDINLADRYAEP
jgi:hypothetical protein